LQGAELIKPTAADGYATSAERRDASPTEWRYAAPTEWWIAITAEPQQWLTRRWDATTPQS